MKTHSISTFKSSAVLALFLAISLMGVSCSEDGCEENITGTIVFENTDTEATLQISINSPFTSVNGPGDLSVPPGESSSYTAPAGPLVIYARKTASVCNGSRCSLTVSPEPNRETDLASCERVQLVY